MSKLREFWQQNTRSILLLMLAVAVVAALLLYQLGSLVGGLSKGEQATAIAPIGWHGIYHNPFYLPLIFVRSLIWFLSRHHGQTLTRLPNALFGGLAIVSFAYLVKLWHNARTAVLATCLFATSAWVLHVSRVASPDVLYLCAVPVILAVYMTMTRGAARAWVYYGSVMIWGLSLYIPGMVWFVLLEIFWLRRELREGWQHFNGIAQRLLYVLAWLIWLPLLAWNLRYVANLRLWIGLPSHFAGPMTIAKQFGGVFVHLFVRGPQYPQLWLMRAPILDVFTLVACLLGIYFYVTHLSNPRGKLLISLSAIGVILVTLGGPVDISMLVPLVYLTAATGIAYLLHRWLRIFPLNPLARGFGITLIVAAVALSCVYNLRAYFVAWPHNATARATFRYRR